VQQARAAAGRRERQQYLVPDDPAIETPWIESCETQRDGLDAGAGQILDEAAAVRADAGCGADGLLRIERDAKPVIQRVAPTSKYRSAIKSAA